MPDFRAIWTQVITEPYGLRIQTNSPETAKSELNAARREMNLPALSEFSVALPADAPDEVWIFRKDKFPIIHGSGDAEEV